MLEVEPICPRCKQSYYVVTYTNSSIFFSFTNGINDPNYSIDHCQCLNCGTNFTISRHNGICENTNIENMYTKMETQWKKAANDLSNKMLADLHNRIKELQSEINNKEVDAAVFNKEVYPTNPY